MRNYPSSIKNSVSTFALNIGLTLIVGLSALPAWADKVIVPADATAADGTGAAAQPGAPGMLANLFPMIAIFAIFYFLMIRPQQKKLQEEQNRKKELLENLKHGDEVVTHSGILGKVTGIADKVVTLEVSDNVKLKMLKSQVTQVIKQGQVKDLA